jgi:predicted nicotinamide N-methyase
VREVAIPGGWTEQKIELCDRAFSILRPANADEFLEHLADEQQPLHIADPYWARLWPTSLTMAELVVRETWPRVGRVLELGCGIGIVGLAALARGMPVTFTDYVPLAVELAGENARRNGFTDWVGQVLDWRRPPSEKFSVILASDVLYDPKQHDAVLSLIDSSLDAGGICWIGDPGRYYCDAFVRAAESRGYAVTMRDQYGQAQHCVEAGEFCLLVIQR